MMASRHQDNDPPKRVVISLPMPAMLFDRIDAEVAIEQRRTPHQFVSRCGMIRELIADVLDQREYERKLKAGPPRAPSLLSRTAP